MLGKPTTKAKQQKRLSSSFTSGRFSHPSSQVSRAPVLEGDQDRPRCFDAWKAKGRGPALRLLALLGPRPGDHLRGDLRLRVQRVFGLTSLTNVGGQVSCRCPGRLHRRHGAAGLPWNMTHRCFYPRIGVGLAGNPHPRVCKVGEATTCILISLFQFKGFQFPKGCIVPFFLLKNLELEIRSLVLNLPSGFG